MRTGTRTYLLSAVNGCLTLLRWVDGGGGLLRVGVPSSGVEPERFEMNHRQGQHHLFGLQIRPDSRSRVWGSRSCWEQGGGSLSDGAAVRFRRRWQGGVGVLSEGSGRHGSSVLCCLLLFGFCWRMETTERRDRCQHEHTKIAEENGKF